MKDLVFISVCPNDRAFMWQVKVMLHNFRKFGYSEKEHVLVLESDQRVDTPDLKPEWDELVKLFPETHFYFYPADENILRMIKNFGYPPIIRPYLLHSHFEQFPEWKEKAVFYHDSDIIFTRPLDFSPFLSDDICYLSDTRGYTGVAYFDSKIRDVDPVRLESFKKLDVVNIWMSMFGLTRQDAINNDEGSGGAQYLLKNIDAAFWEEVFEMCLQVKLFFGGINQNFMKTDPVESSNKTSEEIAVEMAKSRERNGFQSWCADMFSILPCLWKRGLKTKCPPELDFTWRDHKIGRWGEHAIYHDAGSASITEDGVEHHMFMKEKNEYRSFPYMTPFEDDLSHVSPEYCSYNYVQEIKECNQLKQINNGKQELLSKTGRSG